MSRTIRQLNNAVKVKNAIFLALSRAEQRVVIAQDVLSQLGTRIIAESGTYLESSDLDESAENGTAQVQKEFEKVESCTACAIGSMLLCGVDRANAVTVKQLGIFGGGEVSGDGAKRYLRRFFSNLQLCMIESAFENSDFGTRYPQVGYGHAKVELAVTFGNNVNTLTELVNQPVAYENEVSEDENRLRFIMQNIVANGGTFRPEKLPTIQITTPGF